MIATNIIASLCEVAHRAGAEILTVYGSDITVHHKQDASPVTDADRRAEAVILSALADLAPGVPVVAEESVAAGQVPDISPGTFFLVDPLDATREFISRNGEFTVNIALIENGQPTLGVVHLPALEESFWTDGISGAWYRQGQGAPQPIRCRQAPDRLAVVASRSHRDHRTDEYLQQFAVDDLVSAGSSLKFCRVAQGQADLYPRLGRTMEWDVAAGHAVVKAAGGEVTTIEGTAFTYGKPGFENPHFVVRGPGVSLPR